MSCVIGVSSDPSFLAHWCRAVEAAGMRPSAVPLFGSSSQAVDHWLIALDRQEPRPYLFWLRSLGVPITLISSSMAAAYPLIDRVPLIHLLCHTSRAMASLGDILAMGLNISAGSLVLGPITPSVVRSSHLGVEDLYGP